MVLKLSISICKVEQDQIKKGLIIMAQHMQKQVTPFKRWIRVEGTNGTEFIEYDLVYGNQNSKAIEPKFSDYEDFLLEHDESEIFSVELIHGFGARLSAPGYMDCTEWTVFDSEYDANQFLIDTYDNLEEEQ